MILDYQMRPFLKYQKRREGGGVLLDLCLGGLLLETIGKEWRSAVHITLPKVSEAPIIPCPARIDTDLIPAFLDGLVSFLLP